jgi:hypothetical protein
MGLAALAPAYGQNLMPAAASCHPSLGGDIIAFTIPQPFDLFGDWYLLPLFCQRPYPQRQPTAGR